MEENTAYRFAPSSLLSLPLYITQDHLKDGTTQSGLDLRQSPVMKMLHKVAYKPVFFCFVLFFVSKNKRKKVTPQVMKKNSLRVERFVFQVYYVCPRRLINWHMMILEKNWTSKR